MSAWLVLALDLVLAGGAVELVAWLARTVLYPESEVGFVGTTVASTAATVTAAVTAYLTGLHEREVLAHPKQVFTRATLAGLAGGAGSVAVAYLYFYEPVGRVTVVLWAIAIGLVLGTWRMAYGAFLRNGPRIPLIVVGAGATGRRFVELVKETLLTRYQVLGFIDESGPEPGTPPVLGSLDETVAICEEAGVRLVVVSDDDRLTSTHTKLLAELVTHGLQVTTVGTAYSAMTGRIPLDIVSPRWMLEAFEQAERPGRTQVKRLLDVALSLVGLAMLAAILPLLYPAVRATSRGPFLFRQPRVGLGGRLFTVQKIRSMTVAPEDATQRWVSSDRERVTAVGSFLRKFRIDEFPQFWNVLKGEMSVVGPRPEQPELVARLQRENPYFHCRHLVRPGITGWAQINQGYVSTVEDSITKLSYDLYYVRRYGLNLDLDIILRTLFVMFSRLG